MNFNPTIGHEQSGKRPALVVSSYKYNSKSLMFIVCPITTQNKNYPFKVECISEKVSGFILSDQIKNIDWKERKVIYITKVDEATLTAVIDKIKLLID